MVTAAEKAAHIEMTEGKAKWRRIDVQGISDPEERKRQRDKVSAERSAERDWLAVLQQETRGQRASFEHELLLSSQTLAPRLLPLF